MDNSQGKEGNMKVTICDVCKAMGKLSMSKWRVSVKNQTGETFRLDSCDEHLTFMKGKGYIKAREAYHELLKGPQKSIAALFENKKEVGGG